MGNLLIARGCPSFWSIRLHFSIGKSQTIYVAIFDVKSYMLYMIDCESLKASHIVENINISAIKATESGFVMTADRVSNSETAKCNTDYEYLYHDITLDLDGRILRNDSTHEYDQEELKRRYDSDDPFPIVW